MAIYLMVAIGLKGGVAVAAEGFTVELGVAAVSGLRSLSRPAPPAFWLWYAAWGDSRPPTRRRSRRITARSVS